MKREYIIDGCIGLGFIAVIVLLLNSIRPTPEQIQQQHSDAMERECIRKKGHPVMVNERVVDCEGYQGIGLHIQLHK